MKSSPTLFARSDTAFPPTLACRRGFTSHTLPARRHSSYLVRPRKGMLGGQKLEQHCSSAPQVCFGVIWTVPTWVTGSRASNVIPRGNFAEQLDHYRMHDPFPAYGGDGQLVMVPK